MTDYEQPSSEPQNPLPPERSQVSPWAPEYGVGSESNPVMHAAGSAAVRGNVEWDQPERRPVHEAGEFSEEEIEQVSNVYNMLQYATAPPEVNMISGQIDPAKARYYLNNRLKTIQLRLGEGQVSRRTAMIAGAMVAASSLGRGSEEAGRAMELIGGGALPEEQRSVLMTIQGDMVRTLNEGMTDKTAILARIDGFLYGKGVSGEGFLSRAGEPPREGTERAAEFWLAYAAGLDTSSDGIRRFRNLTEYMRTGRRGRDYVPLQE